MVSIIENELQKVEIADLSNFNSETKTYIIPQKKEIKLEVDNYYLINLKTTFFTDEALKTNWNNNSVPEQSYLKIEVNKILNKMVKVTGVGYDVAAKSDLDYYWAGWVKLDEIEILQKL